MTQPVSIYVYLEKWKEVLWVRPANVTHDLCPQAVELRHMATPNQRAGQSSQAVLLGGKANGLLNNHSISARARNCFFFFLIYYQCYHMPDPELLNERVNER